VALQITLILVNNNTIKILVPFFWIVWVVRFYFQIKRECNSPRELLHAINLVLKALEMHY